MFGVFLTLLFVMRTNGLCLAAAAHKIVAQPGTLTGSIGVLCGHPYLTPALRKLGVNVESVMVGKHAMLYSPYHKLTPEEVCIRDDLADRSLTLLTARSRAACYW